MNRSTENEKLLLQRKKDRKWLMNNECMLVMGVRSHDACERHDWSVQLDECTDFFVEVFESESEVAEPWPVCGCERPTPPH